MNTPDNKIDFSQLKNIVILYVEDEQLVREKVLEFLTMRFETVHTASNGRDGLQMFNRYKPDLVITDIKMPIMNGLELARHIKNLVPNMPVIVLTAFSEVSFLMQAIEIGVDSYVQKPTEGDKLLDAIYKCALPLIQKKEIDNLNENLLNSLAVLLGKSAPIQKISQQIVSVARSNFSVLIQGETGVGKSLIAQTIHNLSTRSDKPFVTVDIGTMPETLVESELFGYKKGAFTGAVKDKKGLFETAHGGTLFLDELENMNPYVQGKLLRAVEEKKIYPLGSTNPIFIDIRVIGASNKNLSSEVKEKHFREDLYYRLCEFNIDVPPLRKRTEDLPLLALRFAKEAGDELNKPINSIDDDAILLLMLNQWEGNIRELKNAMRRITLFCESDIITAADVTNVLSVQHSKDDPPTSPPPAAVLPEMSVPFYPISEVEKWAISKVLAHVKGKKLQAASLLEIDYKTLVSKIKKYDLS